MASEKIKASCSAAQVSSASVQYMQSCHAEKPLELTCGSRMDRSFASIVLLALLLAVNLDQVQSRPHESLCPLIEVALPQRADVISAGATKFAPGYLIGVKRGISGVPDGKICTATGSPVGEREGALGKALLSGCGLPLPGGTVHNTTADGVCIQDQSGVVSTHAFVYLKQKLLILRVGNRGCGDCYTDCPCHVY